MSDIIALPEQKPILPGQQPGSSKWGHAPDGSHVALLLFGLGAEPLVLQMSADEARWLCNEGICHAGAADEKRAAKKGKVIV